MQKTKCLAFSLLTRLCQQDRFQRLKHIISKLALGYSYGDGKVSKKKKKRKGGGGGGGGQRFMRGINMNGVYLKGDSERESKYGFSVWFLFLGNQLLMDNCMHRCSEGTSPAFTL